MESLRNVIQICFANAPSEFVDAATAKLVDETGKLHAQSVKAAIDRQLTDPRIRQEVIEYLAKEPVKAVNISFYKLRIPLLLEIVEAKLKGGRYCYFRAKINLTNFSLYLDEEPIGSIPVSNCENKDPQFWARLFCRTAFLSNVEVTINMSSNNGKIGDTMLKAKLQRFLMSFERRKWTKESDRMQYVIEFYTIPGDQAVAVLEPHHHAYGSRYDFGCVL